MSAMATENESIDISHIKLAALRPLEPLGQSNTQDAIALNDRGQAVRNAFKKFSSTARVESRNESSTDPDGPSTIFQRAQYFSQPDSLAHLASTVPDSQGPVRIEDFLQSLSSDKMPTIQKMMQKMSSQTSLPQDTQPISQTALDSILSKNKIARQPGDEMQEASITQGTLNEGDDGHVDLLSSYHRTVQDLEDDEEGDDLDIFSPTQPQMQLSRFPESQRFKTPATAGKKRDYNGDFVESPSLPRNPLARNELATGRIIGLSQAFAGTQAISSPLLSSLPHLLPSDRPSPDIAVQVRPATVSTSSPLLEYNRNAAEPSTCYKPLRVSQAEREQRAHSEGFEENVSTDDEEFQDQPSLVKRQLILRERELVARRQLEAVRSIPRAKSRESVVKHSSSPRKSTLSSPRRGYGRQKHRKSLPGLVDDDLALPVTTEKTAESEDETDHETGIEIAVKRSSQALQFTEEDKENAPYGPSSIPETMARPRHTIEAIAEVDASPSLAYPRSHSRVADKSELNHGEDVEPFAVENSQPSLPASTMAKLKDNLFSSGEGSEVVQKSQRTGLSPGLIAQTDEDETAEGTLGHGFTNGPPNQPISTASQYDTYSRGEGTPYLSRTRTGRRRQDQQDANSTMPEASSTTRAADLAQDNAGPQLPSFAATRIDSTQGHNQSVYDTAPSHLSAGQPATSKDEHNMPAPLVRTPRGSKRLQMTDIAEEPSPQRSSNGLLKDMLAAIHDPDINDLLGSQSPRRPGRKGKQLRSLQTPPHLRIPSEQLSDKRKLQCKEKNLVQTNSTNDSKNPSLPSSAVEDDASQLSKHSRELSPAIPVFVPIQNHRNTRIRSRRAGGSVWDVQATPSPKKPAVAPKTQVAVKEALMRSKRRTTAPAVESTFSIQLKDDPPAEDDANPSNQEPQSSITPGHDTAPPDKVIFPNQVWACFNGKSRAYYPARCLGVCGADTLKYNIQWDGYDPDEVDAHGVRQLDLRTGDIVKVDYPGFPKYSHVIRGLTNKTDEGMTDIRGFQTVLIAPKQRKSLPTDIDLNDLKEVPISAIYLDSNMWGQMKDRKFEYAPPETSISRPGFTTPGDRPSTPSTPSSRNRRIAASASLPTAPVLEPALSGMFSKMAFAISYDDTSRKSSLTQKIKASGGLILTQGFHEILHADTMTPKPQYSDLGFCALLADRHSRKEKYMQALALGIPCLSGRWVEEDLEKSELVDWRPYLLPAGESTLLDGATRSRVLPYFNSMTTTLHEMLQSRPDVLNGADVIVAMGRGKAEERRKPYLFLVQALGAGRIEKVADVRGRRELLRDKEEFEWVFVDDRDVGSAKGILGKESAAKVVGNEFIVQSLIAGRRYEG